MNYETKVCIICPYHGEFFITPHHFLNGIGCKKCGVDRRAEKRTFTLEKFIERAKIVHGDKYDYSKVIYEKVNKKVCIICSDHGEFWQTPYSHIRGIGCPYCNESKMEIKIRKLLIEKEINFEQQKRFKWLGNQSLDFYLPDYNIAIECQGLQHFKPIEYFGGEKDFIKRIKLDNKKYKKCKKNNINILYYSEYDYPNMIQDVDLLIEKIREVNL